jgi:hypothetical protein
VQQKFANTTRADWDRILAGHLTGLDLPVDGGFTELGTYRQVWRRATGKT